VPSGLEKEVVDMSRMTTRALRTVIALTVGLLVLVAPILPAAAGWAGAGIARVKAADAPQMTLWNGLGNAHQVTHSFVGPGLKLGYMAPGCTGVAVPGFTAGVVQRGLTVGSVPGGVRYDRVCNAVITKATTLYTPDRGTIELWFDVKHLAVPYKYGIYRLYNGAFGPGHGGPEIAVEAAGPGTPGAHLYFDVGGGEGNVTATSLASGEPWIDVSGRLGQWVDLVAMWDRAGIAGTSDTLRLYLDGTLVATATASNWSAMLGRYVDVAGGNDGAKLADKFAVDELKVWNGVTFAPLGG
jgi:hypothetical protein